MTYYTYVLKSITTNKLYIGSSQNWRKRLDSHNRGYNQYTKVDRPWEIIGLKSFDNRADAMREEKSLKRKKSRKYTLDWTIENPFRSSTDS